MELELLIRRSRVHVGIRWCDPYGSYLPHRLVLEIFLSFWSNMQHVRPWTGRGLPYPLEDVSTLPNQPQR